MRRNGENLLILAGDRSPRARQAPIRFGDIARAAISEVESYQRVHIESAPTGSLTAAVAVDLVHMLAELVDNALRASPPDTTVTIGFTRTIEGGTVISVVDHGIGISRQDQATINARLATRADATTDTTRHMGLFVVGQLAARHWMTVQLSSTLGAARNAGVTATVDIPGRLLVAAADTPALPTAAAESRRSEHLPVPAPSSVRQARPAPDALPALSADDDRSPVSVRRQREASRDGIAAPADHPPTVNGTGTGPSELKPRHLRAVAQHPVPAPVPGSDAEDVATVTTPIYFGMVSEWLTDPTTTRSRHSGRDWVSPADSGWSAARHAAEAAVDTVTESGLPQRVPGQRLVPGGVTGAGPPRRRDPESIRDSLTAHLSGVRDGRATRADPGDEDPIDCGTHNERPYY
ncbi:sensor histidine kinase [Rhodococcus sp. NPDC019627]|uniref:sensor histidine kinase n=1 Tax=unclassified Rhodococcus (in: high G+C Gram-positive bacteria) TaxID=192944 RepID=UPI0033F385FB